MAESTPPSTSNPSTTQVVTENESQNDQVSPPVLHLRLQKPKAKRGVKWSTDTVDNEFMGKKKSKCCCIYEKPKVFGESDTSSDDDSSGDDDCTAHCHGHKKKCYQQKQPHTHPHPHSHSHDATHGSDGEQQPDDAG